MDSPAKINPPASATSLSFENFLVENGFIKAQLATQIRALEQKTGQYFSQVLLAEKALDEEGLAKAKAAFFNIPYVDLRQMQVPPSVLSYIPQESINFYNIVPFEIKDKNLKAVFYNKLAPISYKTLVDSQLQAIYMKNIVPLSKGTMDINTLLRTAEEEANKFLLENPIK